MRDPLAPFDFVLSFDPAIDDEDPPAPWPEDYVPAAERARRFRDGWDASHLRFKHGQTPALFKCRPIDAAYCYGTLSELTGLKQIMRALLAGCIEVRMPDGVTILKPAKTEVTPEGAVVAAPSWVQTIVDNFGARAVTEVGSTCFVQSTLPQGERLGFTWPAGRTPSP